MRNLTKQEMSNVAGAMSGSAFIEAGFGWFVTDNSKFEFDDYNYYASYVEDNMGKRIFSGHEGEFKNSVGKTCYVRPNDNGNNYVYLYKY